MGNWNEDDHPRDDDGKFSSGGGGSGEDDAESGEESTRPSRQDRLATARGRHAEAVQKHAEAQAETEAARVAHEANKRILAEVYDGYIAANRENAKEATEARKVTRQQEREFERLARQADKAGDAAETDEESQRQYGLLATYGNLSGDADSEARDAARYARGYERAAQKAELGKQSTLDLTDKATEDDAKWRHRAERHLDNGDIDELAGVIANNELRGNREYVQALVEKDRLFDLSHETGDLKYAEPYSEVAKRTNALENDAYDRAFERLESRYPQQFLEDIDFGTSAERLSAAQRRSSRAEKNLRIHEREVKRLEKAIDRDGDGRVNEEERGTTEADRAETTKLPLAQTKREIWKVEARAAKQLEIDLYDDIGGIALLGGGVTAGNVRASLKGQRGKDVLCRIHSAGGIVTEGLAIYNIFKQHDGKVVCRVDSLAGSIASVIAMAGDELEMAEHSYLMIHNPFGMVEGGASELRSQANLLESMREQMIDIYCAKSGRARDEIGKLMDDETWMTAREALAFGFANRVIPDSGAKLAAHVDVSKFAKAPESIRASVFRLSASVPLTVVADSMRAALEQVLAQANVTVGSGVTDSLAVSQTQQPAAAETAPQTEEKPMAMTEEETKKLADLEAQNTALQAALDAEKGARATAEDALAKSKSKAEMDEEDEEEDEEETAAKAVVDACVAITGVKDIRKLEGAVMALGPRLHGAANAAAARKLQVSQLIASGKLLPAQKAWALKCKPEALEGYLDALGDAKVGPVGEELAPDDDAPEVAKARAATASAFDPTKVELSPSELAIVKQMGENDPKLGERMLADKRAKAEAEHRAKYGQPRA